jgi:hypothetical protein
MAMYLRTTQRRRRDGSVVRYLQLAHNRRVGGATRAEVLLNLGREDLVDRESLRRLADSIIRFTDGEDAPSADEVEVVAARPLGAAWLLETLWWRLGAGAALGATGGWRRRKAVERALLDLVVRRVAAPAAGAVAAGGAAELPGGPEEAASMQAAIADAVVADPSPDGLAVVSARVPFGSGGADGALAVALTPDGLPLRAWGWPEDPGLRGAVARVRADLRAVRSARHAWVFEGGAPAAPQRRALERLGVAWIAGQPAHGAPPEDRAVLARPGRYREVEPGLRVRETRSAAPGGRLIVCHDAAAAERDRLRREEVLDRATIAQGPDQPSAVAGGPAPVTDSRLDGRFLVRTSDAAMTAAEAALGHRARRRLLPALRSVFARPPPPELGGSEEQRAALHVLTGWLALLLMHVAERAAGRRFDELARELEAIHVVSLAGPGGRVERITRLTPDQRAIFDALGINPPRRVRPAA